MYIAFGCQAMLGVVETAEIAGQFQHTSRPFRVIQRHVWLPFEPRTIMFVWPKHPRISKMGALSSPAKSVAHQK